MPVDGYEHKRVWQYKFRPQPVSLLDRGWVNRDKEWELGLVARLKRGGTVECSSLVDSIRPNYQSVHIGSWEAAEEHAKNAIRTNAAFLNDEAIAHRDRSRKGRVAAYLKMRAEEKARWERERPEREARRAAQERRETELQTERKQAEEEYYAAIAERQRKQAEQEAAWRAEGKRRLEEAAETHRLLATPERQREIRLVMSKQWGCFKCGTQCQLRPYNLQFAMTCNTCRTTAVYEHEDLLMICGKVAAPNPKPPPPAVRDTAYHGPPKPISAIEREQALVAAFNKLTEKA